MEIDTIAALAGPEAAPVMAHRAELMAASRRSEKAVMAPCDPGGLSCAERLALACRIAELNGDKALAEEYAARADGGAVPQHARWAAILRHVDLVTTRPKDATCDDIVALRAAGIEEADIVRLSQVVAFVNYQVRVIAGLRLIGAA